MRDIKEHKISTTACQIGRTTVFNDICLNTVEDDNRNIKKAFPSAMMSSPETSAVVNTTDIHLYTLFTFCLNDHFYYINELK